MKITFCTTVMDRARHITETLPKNIADNKEANFVVLDYNSQDGVAGWIRDHMIDHIRSGKLTFYRECTATHFSPPHSRNVCALMAEGDVICNIDGDNFTTADLDVFIRHKFENK